MEGKFYPPINFAWVEEGVCRCGEPSEVNYPFLDQLSLRRIIYLAPNDPPQHLHDFVEDNDIEFVRLDPRSARNTILTESIVVYALKFVLDKTNYPLAIMCNFGRHRTGVLVGCLRKLQKWSLTSIFEEYRRFAEGKFSLMHEQFIEMFDTDLISIPNSPPEWL